MCDFGGPALAPVEYAQYFSERLDANALPAYVQPTYAEPIACVLHEANSLNFVTASINLCLGFSIILLDLLVTIAE